MTAAQRTEYLAEIDRLRVQLETLRAHAEWQACRRLARMLDEEAGRP